MAETKLSLPYIDSRVTHIPIEATLILVHMRVENVGK